MKIVKVIPEIEAKVVCDSCHKNYFKTWINVINLNVDINSVPEQQVPLNEVWVDKPDDWYDNAYICDLRNTGEITFETYYQWGAKRIICPDCEKTIPKKEKKKRKEKNL